MDRKLSSSPLAPYIPAALLVFSACLLFPGALPAEIFHLKNGKTLKGDLKKENDEHYFIELKVGSTRLPKKDVLRVEEKEPDLSPMKQLEKRSRKASTKEEYIAAAEFGFQNGLDSQAILILKRAWKMDGKKDAELEAKIRRAEQERAKKIHDEALEAFEKEHFRKCAEILSKNLQKYERYKIGRRMHNLKIRAYESCLSEEESLAYLDDLFRELDFFKVHIHQPSGSRSRRRSGSRSNEKDGDSLFSRFAKDEKTLDPLFSKIIASLYRVFQMRRYILDNDFHSYSSRGLHSKEELDAARADRARFNSFRSENNRIYKSRHVCRQYNQILSNLKQEFSELKTRLEKEAVLWKNKGYEKIHGEWLEGDSVKRARGWILYKGTWLDPNHPDFEKQKAKTDNWFESLKKVQKREPEKSAPEESEPEDFKRIGTVEDMEAEMIERSQTVAKKIQTALKGNDRKQAPEEKAAPEPEPEKPAPGPRPETPSKGLPVGYGAAIVGGLLIFLFFLRKK
jgi:hypothetical protein